MFIAGRYEATPIARSEGDVQIAVDQYGNLKMGTSGPSEEVTLTKAAVTMTGASGVLVAADPTRRVVIVASTATNAAAAVDPTGGTCALDAGIPLNPGAWLSYTGKAAQSAMTQIGTNTQKLTVYTG